MKDMKIIDERIRGLAASEQWSTPDLCTEHVEKLLENLPDTPPKEEKMRRVPKKRIILMAAALTAVLGATAAAAELFSWNEQAVESFGNPTEDEQNVMAMEGLAKEQSISVTDAGLTMTAVQTVQDKNSLYILLELSSKENIIDGNSGFENATDGVYSPWLITSDGTDDAFAGIGCGFPKDTPCFDLSDHGYYEISAIKSLDKAWTADSVTVQFTEFCYYTGQEGSEVSHTIKGSWTLTIPLGEETMQEAKTYEPKGKAELGGVPVQIKRVELSPLSMIMSFDLEDVKTIHDTLYEGQEDVYLDVLSISGFLDENGKEIALSLGGMNSMYDYDAGEVIHEVTFGQYVDPDHISAALLGDEKVPVYLK